LEQSVYDQVIGATATKVFGLTAIEEKLGGGNAAALDESLSSRA
jgi:hypothetical protein